MSIFDILRRSPVATASSAELRASLSQMVTERDAAATLINELEAQSGDIMLEGNRERIDAHWLALQAARLEVERLEAAVAAMPAKIDAADKAEHMEALGKTRQAAEAAAAEWLTAAPDLVATCERLWELIEAQDARMAKILEANAQLRGSGQVPVPRPQAQFWSRAESTAVPYASIYGRNTALPGPRGTCTSRAEWRREVDRAQSQATDADVVVPLPLAS